MDSESRVYVAGNTGLVGSAIVRMLHWKGYTNILSSPSSHWDLRNQSDVERFFRDAKILALSFSLFNGLSFPFNFFTE